MTRRASIARGVRNGWRALAAAPVAFAAAGDVAIFNEFRAQHERLERPVGVAYRTDGSLAVLEADRARVRILDSAGNEIGRLGEGRLTAPAAIAARPDGTLVVADRGRDEVVAFAGDGSVRTLVDAGSTVDPIALSVTDDGSTWLLDAGLDGRGRLGPIGRDGGFDPKPLEGPRSPAGLAVVDASTAIVSDADLHALWAVPLAGGPARRLLGERGAFPGLLNVPRAVATFGGNVYVAEEFNHRVGVYGLSTGPSSPAALRYLDLWGMHAVIPREGEGKFHYPAAIAFSPDGTELAIAEPFERRVQRFGRTPPGGPRAELPPREGIQSHFGASLASDGDLLVLHEPESAAVFVFDLRGDVGIHVTTFGSADARGPDSFGRITAVDVDADRQEIAIADAGRGRLALMRLDRDRAKPLLMDPFMTRLSLSWDLAEGLGPRSWLARLAAIAPGDRPGGIAPAALASRDGRRFLLDGRRGEIIELDATLAPVASIATGLGGGTSLGAMPDGRFAIALPEAGRVAVVDALGRESASIAAGLVRPTGVAAFEGDLVIAFAATDEVVRMSPEGEIRWRVGSRGISDGEFWMPGGVAAMDLGGEVGLAVVDVGNHRVQLLRPDGSWRMTFGLGRAYTRPRQRGES
jgi:DNA-binding beta-propeller fold protein YncE